MRRGKLIITIAVILVLLGLVGGAGFFFRDIIMTQVKVRLLGQKPPAGSGAAPEAPPPRPAADAQFYDLPDIMITMHSPNARNQLLRLSVSLKLWDPDDMTRVQSYLPRILDAFQVGLQDITIEDVNNVRHLEQLRQDMLKRVNEVVAPAKVDQVMFREVLVE